MDRDFRVSGSCSSSTAASVLQPARERLVNGAAGFGIDARLQLPALAALQQLGDQRGHIVAIFLVRAGEGEAAVMLHDPVVILGKPSSASALSSAP
jgi:hypothetical protein